MCGIVGYVGNKNAQDFLISGLKRLEYRGYDSAGIVTLDADGAFVATKDGSRMVPSFRVEAVDTTGAGDSFWGGFLTAFVESGLAPSEVSIERAAQFVRFGNAVASLCVRNRGAIPAMPERKDVEEVLAVAADQA